MANAAEPLTWEEVDATNLAAITANTLGTPYNADQYVVYLEDDTSIDIVIWEPNTLYRRDSIECTLHEALDCAMLYQSHEKHVRLIGDLRLGTLREVCIKLNNVTSIHIMRNNAITVANVTNAIGIPIRFTRCENVSRIRCGEHSLLCVVSCRNLQFITAPVENQSRAMVSKCQLLTAIGNVYAIDYIVGCPSPTSLSRSVGPGSRITIGTGCNVFESIEPFVYTEPVYLPQAADPSLDLTENLSEHFNGLLSRILQRPTLNEDEGTAKYREWASSLPRPGLEDTFPCSYVYNERLVPPLIVFAPQSFWTAIQPLAVAKSVTEKRKHALAVMTGIAKLRKQHTHVPYEIIDLILSFININRRAIIAARTSLLQAIDEYEGVVTDHPDIQFVLALQQLSITPRETTEQQTDEFIGVLHPQDEED
jgi:hypothetical protein